DLDFSALALKGRIVIVGTGAGEQSGISLRTLMAKRASLRGTMLRARPLEEKAAAVQAFARSVVPLLAAGRALPEIDRVFPAAEAAGGFDYVLTLGKPGKVLLEFACPPGRPERGPTPAALAAPSSPGHPRGSARRSRYAWPPTAFRCCWRTSAVTR